MNEIVFAGAAFKVGRWRLPAVHPSFHDSGPTRHYLFVFPRTSAWIAHAGERPFAADANVVTFYNRGQEYTRGAIAPVGDCSDYYAVAPEVLREVIAPWDPHAADAAQHIFRVSRGPSDADAYLAQRAVYSHVRACSEPDRLFVEETLLHVLARVVGCAYGVPSAAPPASRDLVERTRAVLAQRCTAPATLVELAREADASVFQLCRVFRRLTGTTMHAYRNQLRLRAALHAVLDSRRELTEIALAHGYSSHSHFTAAFRTHYGVTPSMARRGCTCRRTPRSTSSLRRLTAARAGEPCRLRG